MNEFEPVNISAMESSETEVVQFCQYIIPSLSNGLVEKWLQQVEFQMRTSLNFEIKKCMNAFRDETTFMNLVKKYPGQVLLACNCLYWTSDVTKVGFYLLLFIFHFRYHSGWSFQVIGREQTSSLFGLQQRET
jgi:hypothetical protein